MEKCSCYHEREVCYSSCPPKFRTYGICYGTRECEECNCGGDESKCTFYPEKRKKAEKTMNTAEMWINAQEDGETYVSKNAEAIYSKELGLVEIDDLDKQIDLGNFPDIEHLMTSNWTKLKIMTRTEAEKQLRVKIVD